MKYVQIISITLKLKSLQARQSYVKSILGIHIDLTSDCLHDIDWTSISERQVRNTGKHLLSSLEIVSHKGKCSRTGPSLEKTHDKHLGMI